MNRWRKQRKQKDKETSEKIIQGIQKRMPGFEKAASTGTVHIYRVGKDVKALVKILVKEGILR